MPRCRSGELGHAEQAADRVQGRSNVQVQMGVHAAGDPAAGFTIVIAIPSLAFVKGWHALHQVCGGGAIALVVQGGPPHPMVGLCHWSPGAGRQIVMRTG